MSKKRNKKKIPRTIGEMTNSRGTWQMNPVTRIKEDVRKKNDRKEIKKKIRKGDFDE